jgi:hypothetical protein
MLSAGRRRSESQHGQALVLVALALPLFFAVVALVVDGSTLMAKRRAIQNAADASALAGSQELPASGPCLIVLCQPRLKAKIEEYSALNGGPATLNGAPGGRCHVPTDTNCYTNPYKGNDQLLEVRLQMPVTTFFTATAHILGPFSVGARAVGSAGAITTTSTTTIPGTTIDGTTINGQTIPGTTINGTTVFGTSTSSSTTTTSAGNIALFAKDAVCGATNGITLGNTGNSLVVTGVSISNSGFTIDGNPQTHLDTAVYGGPNHCTIGGSRASNVTTKINHTDLRDWPKTWDSAAICAMPGATVFNDTLTHTVPANANGIYCALNGGLALGGDGKITMIAKSITFPVQTVHITPGSMTFLPNNSSVAGWIWVPNGRLTYGGNSATQGFYEAFDISIQGNSFNITGNGPEGEVTTSTTSSTTTTATTIPGTTTGPTTIPGVTTPGSTTPGSTVTSTNVVGTTIGLDE